MNDNEHLLNLMVAVHGVKNKMSDALKRSHEYDYNNNNFLAGFALNDYHENLKIHNELCIQIRKLSENVHEEILGELIKIANKIMPIL